MPKVETFNKEVVIKQATEVFHRKSYSLTSMQDLVDATGLNRSSIYNTFGSKLDLYTVCLKSYQTNFKCSIENILKNINSPLKAIEAIFILNIKQNKNNKNIGCLINNCTSEMANQEVTIQKFLDNNHKSMIKLFQDFIEKGQQEGSINKNNTAYEYALYLLNSIQGLSISGILMNNCKHLESIVKTTLSTLK
ncbi:helix-turn-helix domain-containing protein [uncultured Tenacibaculum sp.]|uniref:TetR/AcrR family transcriptional regulator n=1 Tax=uncultured Tenacibaculum sp. TaxID=174713 RepID=UPI00262580A0|nr:helix-turn-helix domain-containing protein [uncultured Tenacibaculum sp.]